MFDHRANWFFGINTVGDHSSNLFPHNRVSIHAELKAEFRLSLVASRGSQRPSRNTDGGELGEGGRWGTPP